MYYLIALLRFDSKNRWAYCNKSRDRKELEEEAAARTNKNFIYKVIPAYEAEVYNVYGLK